MKREIKFRAWQTGAKKMLLDVGFHPHMATDLAAEEPYYETNEEGRWIVTPKLGFEIMQFTGLKDRKGNEIFEGDIVKWGHLKGYSQETPHRIAIVELFPSLQFRNNDGHVFEFGSFAYQETNKYLEIIGNIHENPNLLL